MAVGKHHRMDKEAREFSKKLLGRGGVVTFRPTPPPEAPIRTEELEAKSEEKE